MPYRLTDRRAKIQFITSARMPSLIYRAVCAGDKVSNTQYIQHAVCEALARDLNIPIDELLGELPMPAGPSLVPFGEDRRPRRAKHNEVESVG